MRRFLLARSSTSLYYGNGSPESWAPTGVYPGAALSWSLAADRSFLSGEFSDALQQYERAADLGHFRAPLALFQMYRDGLGAEADMRKAVPHLLEAADAGCPRAQAFAAQEYLLGIHLPRDTDRAIELLEAAIEGPEGSRTPGPAISRAQTLSGILARGALDVFEPDRDRALQLFETAVEHDPEAQWQLYRLHCETGRASGELCETVGIPIGLRAIRLPYSGGNLHIDGHLAEGESTSYALWSLAAAEGSSEAAEHLARDAFSTEAVTKGGEWAEKFRREVASRYRLDSELPRCYESVWPMGIPEPDRRVTGAMSDLDYWSVAESTRRTAPSDLLNLAIDCPYDTD